MHTVKPVSWVLWKEVTTWLSCGTNSNVTISRWKLILLLTFICNTDIGLNKISYTTKKITILCFKTSQKVHIMLAVMLVVTNNANNYASTIYQNLSTWDLDPEPLKCLHCRCSLAALKALLPTSYEPRRHHRLSILFFLVRSVAACIRKWLPREIWLDSVNILPRTRRAVHTNDSSEL